jgi:hypothetical protein
MILPQWLIDFLQSGGIIALIIVSSFNSRSTTKLTIKLSRISQSHTHTIGKLIGRINRLELLSPIPSSRIAAERMAAMCENEPKEKKPDGGEAPKC